MIALLSALTLISPVLMAQIRPGDKLPMFSLKSYDGREYSIEKIRHGAKGLVVMFFSDKCQSFRDYVERLNSIEKQYRNKGILLLAISVNTKESADELRAAVRLHAMHYLVLADDERSVQKLFGVREVPEVFVFTDGGVCIYRGSIDDNVRSEKAKRAYLREALDAVLVKGDMKPSRTTVEGCSIR